MDEQIGFVIIQVIGMDGWFEAEQIDESLGRNGTGGWREKGSG